MNDSKLRVKRTTNVSDHSDKSTLYMNTDTTTGKKEIYLGDDKYGEYDPNGGQVNLLDVYPVGSIYISVNNTDPGTLFGGTWQAFGAGRVLLGAGTPTQNTNTTYGSLTDDDLKQTFKAGDTLGETNHVITQAELADHLHNTMVDIYDSGEHDHTGTTNVAAFTGNIQVDKVADDSYGLAKGGTFVPMLVAKGDTSGVATIDETLTTDSLEHQHQFTTDKDGVHFHGAQTSENGAGNDQGHNNMMPSIVVYMFQRTA